MIPVKVVARQGQSLLVEWMADNGRYQRGYLPKSDVIDNEADPSKLALAIPFGIDWSNCLPEITPPSPESIANELRRAGIWSLEDARNNGAVAVGALMRVYRIGLGLLVEAAENCKEN